MNNISFKFITYRPLIKQAANFVLIIAVDTTQIILGKTGLLLNTLHHTNYDSANKHCLNERFQETNHRLSVIIVGFILILPRSLFSYI